jgi:hypothetical protein
MRIDELLPTLSTAVASHTLETLRAALPAPVPDAPEQRIASDQFAIATIAVMKPRDAAGAVLAVQAVVHGAHAIECLRLSSRPGVDGNATAPRPRN